MARSDGDPLLGWSLFERQLYFCNLFCSHPQKIVRLGVKIICVKYNRVIFIFRGASVPRDLYKVRRPSKQLQGPGKLWLVCNVNNASTTVRAIASLLKPSPAQISYLLFPVAAERHQAAMLWAETTRTLSRGVSLVHGLSVRRSYMSTSVTST